MPTFPSEPPPPPPAGSWHRSSHHRRRQPAIDPPSTAKSPSLYPSSTSSSGSSSQSLNTLRFCHVYNSMIRRLCSIVSICSLTFYALASLAILHEVPKEYPLQNVHSSSVFVAIVSCIKSRGPYPATPLQSYLLPSIDETITQQERATYRVELILGYDDGDEYWERRENQLRAIESMEHFADYGDLGQHGQREQNEQQYFGRHGPIPVSFVSIRNLLPSNASSSTLLSPSDPSSADNTALFNNNPPNRIPFNELCQAAYDYGATYIVRVNDDTQFVTPGWITLAIQTLQSYTPPNVGVVGPTCHDGNAEILTHDMVHAPTHYAIFDTYYPPAFHNWYVDDWITKVYDGVGRANRMTKLKEWEVRHHHLHTGTRYKPSKDQEKLLEGLVKDGKEKVEKFVNGSEAQMTPEGDAPQSSKRYSVLGTDILGRVDGPMSANHLSSMKNHAMIRTRWNL